MPNKKLALLVITVGGLLGLFSTHAQTNEQQKQIAVLITSAPEYPVLARVTNSKGNVLVDVDVDAEGNVASATAIDGHPLLRKSAEAAAMLWKFTSASDGALLRSARVTFVFDIKYEETTIVKDQVVFVPPLRLEFTHKIPTVAALPRVGGNIPEERCPLHGDILKLDVVPILYGLPRATISYRNVDVVSFLRNIKQKLTKRESYSEAQARSFPSSNMFGYGGCMVSYENKTEILYCSRCRAIEARWRKRHPERGPEVVAIISGGKQ